MKYIVILGDGMADYRRGPLGFHTPLDLAKKPNIDALAQDGVVGLIRTVDLGMKPGSDVANLSVLGYDPTVCYTGRSPLEALSIGVPMTDKDTVFRINTVTLSESKDGSFDSRVMEDYSAGEISTEEATELIKALEEKLGGGDMEYHAGTSYRNCAILRGKLADAEFTPPHDILEKEIGEYLPSGADGAFYREIIEKSVKILENHPVNIKRAEQGKNVANAIWFWGRGTKPSLQDFGEKYGLKGAMISAVDLLKGIAVGAKMDVIEVEGATGTLSTNFSGKAQACVDALQTHDYVYLHMEAPDECGHQGDSDGKIKSIEKVDEVVGYIVNALREKDEAFCIAVLPDHATPLVLRTHASDPVPYLVYNSLRPAKCGLTFNEEEAQKGLYLNNGRALIQLMLKS